MPSASAGRSARSPRSIEEGGAKNVARRDGMGTVMLDAAVTIGRMPDYYFQAIGSGTGGIAAWEAALRLRDDGRFGTRLPVPPPQPEPPVRPDGLGMAGPAEESCRGYGYAGRIRSQYPGCIPMS